MQPFSRPCVELFRKRFGNTPKQDCQWQPGKRGKSSGYQPRKFSTASAVSHRGSSVMDVYSICEELLKRLIPMGGHAGVFDDKAIFLKWNHMKGLVYLHPD